MGVRETVHQDERNQKRELNWENILFPIAVFDYRLKSVNIVCRSFADRITAEIFISSTQKYKDSDVEVVRKDGIILLREMAAEVKNFMDFKMNAVMVRRRRRRRLLILLCMFPSCSLLTPPAL